MRTKPITLILFCLALILVAGTRTADGGRFCAEPCDQIIRPGDPYPAYDPNWTKQDCDDYSFSGVGEYYGPDIGRNWGWIDNDKFDTSVEGADCSAYVGRCLALPGFMHENHRKGHQEATSFMYNNGLRDRDQVRRTHRVFSGGTVSQEMDRVEQWDFFVWNWNRNACGQSSNFGGHTGMIRTFSGSNWSTREAMNPTVGIRQTTRSRQQFIDRCTHFWRRNNWGEISTTTTIHAQPRSRINNVGDRAWFSVTATGPGALTYQWRRNGIDISGATNSEFAFPVSSGADAGAYTVAVSSAGAQTVVSQNAILMVPFANRAKITQWNFNNSPHTGASTTEPSLGFGSVMTVGVAASDSSAPRTGAGSDPAAADNFARSLTRPWTGDPNKSVGIRFNVSTVGYTNVVVTFEQRVGARASAYWRGQYTIDGTTWIDRMVVNKRTAYIEEGGTSYTFQFDNLSGVAGVHDNPNFGYRIVAEHESTATGSGSSAYAPANPDDTYNGTGNPVAYWDMVTVMGTVIPTAPPPPNRPPMLAPISNRSVHAGSIVALTSVAFDPDPEDTLTFALDPGAPAAAGIDPSSGLFIWRTDDADCDTTRSITVRVTDDGEPPLSGTATFSVAVLPKSRIEGASIEGNAMKLSWTSIPGIEYQIEYSDTIDESDWFPLGSPVIAEGDLATAIDPDFGAQAQRFYRISVVD